MKNIENIIARPAAALAARNLTFLAVAACFGLTWNSLPGLKISPNLFEPTAAAQGSDPKIIENSPATGPRLEPRISPQAARQKNNLGPTGRAWEDEVVYFLLIDRFHDGDASNNQAGNPLSFQRWDGQEKNRQQLKAYQGGDLAGVMAKLDYLQGLGVTALWLSPVFDNASKDFNGWWPYHGYHPTDFYQVEDHFGDLAALRQLVSAAHHRGMKVILDMIYNHVGPEHPFVADRRNWEERGFRHWFHPHSGKDDSTSIKNWEDQAELETKEVMGLPDLKQDNQHVYDWLLDVSKFWVNETGADAFRLDAVKHVSADFWQRINADMKKWAGPGFFMLGEVFSGDPAYVSRYKNAGFDGIFDIPLYYTIRQVVGQGSSMLLLSDQVIKNQQAYGDAFIPALLIDNHDLIRFSHMAPDRVSERIKLALTLIHTLNGFPVLYYGTEVALAGAPDKDPQTGEGLDYMNRRMMPWAQVEAESKDAGGIIAHIKNLTGLRKGKEQYGKGSLIELYKDATTYVYAKVGNRDVSVVGINASIDRRELTIPARHGILDASSVLSTVLAAKPGPSAVQSVKADATGQIQITLEPYSSLVLEGALPKGFKLTPDAQVAVTPTEHLASDFLTAAFQFQSPEPPPASVSLVGDFNGWKPEAHPMRLEPKSGRWTLSVPLKPGRYLYKFLVNGKDWIPDPAGKDFEPDPYGGKNSVLVLKAPSQG